MTAIGEAERRRFDEDGFLVFAGMADRITPAARLVWKGLERGRT